MTVQDANVVITRHLHEVLHTIHSTYFGDMSFIASAEFTYIVNAILFAEHEGEPLSVRGFAKILDMPHTTLLLRLGVLETRGVIRPRAKRLRSDNSVLLSSAGRTKIGKIRQLIIDHGAELRQIAV